MTKSCEIPVFRELAEEMEAVRLRREVQRSR